MALTPTVTRALLMDFTVPVLIDNSLLMLRYLEEENRLAAIAGPYTYWVILFQKVFTKIHDMKYLDVLFPLDLGIFCCNFFGFNFCIGVHKPMPKQFESTQYQAYSFYRGINWTKHATYSQYHYWTKLGKKLLFPLIIFKQLIYYYRNTILHSPPFAEIFSISDRAVVLGWRCDNNILHF